MPARLRCTWALPGREETITCTHLMNTGMGALAFTALVSIALGVGSHLVRRQPPRQR